MPKKAPKTESLGDRIKKMRESNNIDLNTLAERTGYEVQYLQELEEGKASPPVGALIQISRALAVDTSELLAEERKAERLKSYTQRTKAYSYRNLTPGSEDKHLWAYLITLDPKKEHDPVVYKHEGEEFVYVLEGRVEITVAESPLVLSVGESHHFDSNSPHNLKNLEDTETKLLVVVYTPK